MKKLLAWLTLLTLLMAIPVTACAAGVSATPNQRLALRTGPNQTYVWLGHMPQSTKLTAFEYEKTDSTTWVLVEYENKGMIYRGYCNVKRMDVSGSVPWADHWDYPVKTVQKSNVFAAPTEKAGYRGRVDKGVEVSLLAYEDGYAYIEFNDTAEGADSRGYVPAEVLEDNPYSGDWAQPQGVPATPLKKLALRGGPTTGYVWLGQLAQSTPVTAHQFEKVNGTTWVLIEFIRDGERERAYTPANRLKVNGEIPWADHLNETKAVEYDCEILAAPAADAAIRDSLKENAQIRILEYEGKYALIEYTDSASGEPARGYIEETAIDGYSDWFFY